MSTRTDAAAAAAERARQEAQRRAEEARKRAAAEAAKAVKAAAKADSKKTAKAKFKKDEFSTGRAKAMRAKALAKEQAPALTSTATSAPKGAAAAALKEQAPALTSTATSAPQGAAAAALKDQSPALTSTATSAPKGAAAAAAAAVTAVGGGNAPVTKPVFSFDTATYLSSVGNPPVYRITQQQVDELKILGMQHGVIGMGSPNAPDFAAQMAALHQEVTLLTANGIRTDVYSYMHWTQGSGAPKTDAQVKAEITAQLDQLKGQKVDTFWFDVEADAKLNPAVGKADTQREIDAAYSAFQDWKQANPDSKLEFGIYTSKSIWNDYVSKGPSDPYATKYAEAGVPLWAAQYPNNYTPASAGAAAQDMATNLGAGFGGWSTAAGNIRGWQYKAGEHDGHQPTFNYGLDRNVWLQDASLPPLPITAVPSGPRADLPIKDQALYDLLKTDAGKPIDQRKYKSMQDLINAGVNYKALGINEPDVYKYRWEDPWKVVYGLPLGTDQFTTNPQPPPVQPPPVQPPPVQPPPVQPPPVQPPPVQPPPVQPPPVQPPPVQPPAGSPIGLLGLAPGASSTADQPRIKQLQDTMMGLGYLADIRANSGYGKSFGPLTQAAVKAFQKDKGLPQTGTVDRGTVVALAAATNTPLGFDPASKYASCFGLARGSNGTVDGPAIKLVQDALMAGGYTPASMKTDVGYGRNFGPITEAGLKDFQSDNGLPQTGVVDAATIGALANPRARPAGFAAGVALQYRAQLGLPKGPAYTATDGSLRQDFDTGSVWVTADHVRHVQAQTPAGLQDVVPPRKLGTAQTVEEARTSFLTQWGPTAYNDPPGANDHPYGFEDCGPTSAVMTLSQLGLLARPQAADAEVAIDHMRDQILGYDSTKSLGLNLGPPTVKGTVGYGLTAAGAKVTMLKSTQAEIDAALARGNPVIVGSSTTWGAWGQAQKLAGNYLNNSDPGGHFIVVMGRAPNGNYLVGDPLVKGGPIEVTSAQLKTLLGGTFNSTNAVAEISLP